MIFSDESAASLWQFPHFMSIGWIYREDYARAGHLVLPWGERKSQFVAFGSVLPGLLLLPVSIAPTLLGQAGLLYAIAALILASAVLYCGLQLALHRSNAVAKRLLSASILYLPFSLCVDCDLQALASKRFAVFKFLGIGISAVTFHIQPPI
jgi:heme O synthase-like polyprenyltransferase